MLNHGLIGYPEQVFDRIRKSAGSRHHPHPPPAGTTIRPGLLRRKATQRSRSRPRRDPLINAPRAVGRLKRQPPERARRVRDGRPFTRSCAPASGPPTQPDDGRPGPCASGPMSMLHLEPFEDEQHPVQHERRSRPHGPRTAPSLLRGHHPRSRGSFSRRWSRTGCVSNFARPSFSKNSLNFQGTDVPGRGIRSSNAWSWTCWISNFATRRSVKIFSDGQPPSSQGWAPPCRRGGGNRSALMDRRAVVMHRRGQTRVHPRGAQLYPD